MILEQGALWIALQYNGTHNLRLPHPPIKASKRSLRVGPWCGIHLHKNTKGKVSKSGLKREIIFIIGSTAVQFSCYLPCCFPFTDQRMMAFIKASISTRRMEPLKVPTGFSAVETELSQMLGQFLRLISHNRSVFGPHYSDIISQLLERQQDLSPRWPSEGVAPLLLQQL